MKQQNVIGIDPGKRTGVTITDEHGKIIEQHTLLFDELVEFLNDYLITSRYNPVIVVEKFTTRVVAVRDAHHPLQALGAVKGLGLLYGVPVFEYEPHKRRPFLYYATGDTTHEKDSHALVMAHIYGNLVHFDIRSLEELKKKNEATTPSA